MNLRPVLALMGICMFTHANARINDNAYRSTDNKYYWQNRVPDGAYWQQDVHYKINAKINEEEHKIEGTEELTYWNNSPDTLHYVYIHLFQNAFIKGSYLRDLEIANKVKSRMGKKEAAGLGIVLENVQVDGRDAKTELDNTVMKVYLTSPLLPGSKVALKMNFNTYWDMGATRRRMKMYSAWGFMHYNGCQWYPKISVYDRMHGWDTYQHLGKEFYGDYGLFDVTLDFPSNYVVEASGELENRKEVLPDALRAKLDLKNFANKKMNEAPSTITPYVKGERKKWHFVANNVHDFAFTGDPSYRIGTAYWNGVECVGLAQEPHAAGWQNSAEYASKIIKTFSEGIGMYCYPKIVAADAGDGMEYPMLTLDGGIDPGYRGLLVHEIAHNWFYGQVGSNETYRAAMDEGFTQFLTAYGLRKIDGDNLVTTPAKSGYKRLFAEPINVLDLRVLNSYSYTALNQKETSINTHSDDFNGALAHGGGYGMAYYKTASMLYNLQLVLGDELFEKAMMHYFDQWKFAHPYFEDFRASMIQYTKVDLSWFFDQWFETTKTLDYGICGIHKEKGAGNYAISFSRKGEMQMPLDFTVTAKDGSKHNFYIPNTWFQKNTTATTLPKWTGWGKLHETYTAHVQIPGGIKNVQIDTSNRFADRNMVDNYRSRGLLRSEAIKVKLDGGPASPTDRKHYRMYIRPDAWWNPIDGIKAGLHFEGDYFATMYKLDASVWWNTHVAQQDAYKSFENEGYYDRYKPVNYSINYLSPISRNMPRLQLQVNTRYLDGLWYNRGGFNWEVTDKNVVQLYGQMMWRPTTFDRHYLMDPDEWSSVPGSKNNSINAAWTHNYNYARGNGRYTLSARAPFMMKDGVPFSYSYTQLEAVNYSMLDLLEVRTRFIGRFGLGRKMPYESMLFMAGANPEQQMENKYTRSIGFTPDDWKGTSLYDANHWQQGGGLNLRGYAGYYAPDEHNNGLLTGYKGRSGAGVNMEIGISNYLQWRPRFTRNWLHADIYAFGDAGVMELSSYQAFNFRITTPTATWSTLHADAGAGCAFTIKSWGVFEKAKPLTIRVDFPVFLNRPPYGNSEYVAFRYVVGINRAF